MSAHTPTLPLATRIVWADLDIASRKRAVTQLAAAGTMLRDIAIILHTTKGAVGGFAQREGISAHGRKIDYAKLTPFPVHPQVPEETWAPLQGPRLPSLGAPACQWPSHDGPCGLPVSRKSYCAEHAAMAYRPSVAREFPVKERSPVLTETELRAVERVAFGRRETLEVEE